MSLVVVGVSHHRAGSAALEAVALDAAARRALGDRVLAGEDVAEAVVLSTCNRTEVYAEARTFHGAIADLTAAFVALTGGTREDLAEQVYVHYEDRAIAHAFTVAAGLDSMAVGEAQILGQLRDALGDAQAWQHVGSSLNGLLQQALRVGKRAHTETEIDAVSVSLVQAGLTCAGRELGPLSGQDVLVVGAGGMAALAAATVSRAGARSLTVTNRTTATAERLAARVGAAVAPYADLTEALARADLVLTCTGAAGQIISGEQAAAAGARRGGPQVYVDLAMPHDVDRAVGALPEIRRFGLDDLRGELAGDHTLPAVESVRSLVVAEVAAFLTARSAETVAPTVAALRARAADLVGRELDRLDRRTPDLTDHERAEVARTVHRVVEKLLHTPTVRVKKLAGDGDGGLYAAALRELFELDPHVTATVSAPPETGGTV